MLDAGVLSDVLRKLLSFGGEYDDIFVEHRKITSIQLEDNKVEKVVSNELLFVDLWNLREWYAKEFLKALKQKMGLDQ